jgi:hypothetical protein
MKSDTPLLPTQYNSLIVVQIFKNEGAKTKLILERDQVTMSEHAPHDDCMTIRDNTVDEKI